MAGAYLTRIGLRKRLGLSIVSSDQFIGDLEQEET